MATRGQTSLAVDSHSCVERRAALRQDLQMSSPPAWAVPDRRRGFVWALWGVSVGITALWALTGALFCVATYGVSLAPPLNPAEGGPLAWPPTRWFPVFLLAGLVSLTLAPSPAVALIAGLRWLRRAGLTGWRWQAAWAGSSAAALAVEVLLLRAVIITFSYHGSALRQPNWGPPALAAGFVAAGAAMMVTLAIAARASAGRPPARTAAVPYA
jgi:hypothetical protein